MAIKIAADGNLDFGAGDVTLTHDAGKLLLEGGHLMTAAAAKVKIGGTSSTPQSELEIDGQIMFSTNTTDPSPTGTQGVLYQKGGYVYWSSATVAATKLTDAVSLSDADADTKIQVEESSDEDKIRFDTAGAQRMIIDNAGKVGIGTDAATATLAERFTVWDDNNAAPVGMLIHQNGTNDAKLEMFVAGGSAPKKYSMRVGGAHATSVMGDNNFGIYDESATAIRLLIDNAGNVGIGEPSPSQKLDVNGTATVNGLQIASSTVMTDILDEDAMGSDSATALATQQSIKAYVDASTATANQLSEMTDTNLTTPADGSMLLYDTGTSKWIDNVMSGDATLADTGAITLAATNTNLTTLSNVTSVGTLTGLSVSGGGTPPAFDGHMKLTVTNAAAAGNEASIAICGGATGQSSIYFADTADKDVGAISYDHSVDRLGFRTANTGDRMVLTSAGNVGVGLNNPTAKLEIVDDAATTTNAMSISADGLETGKALFIQSTSSHVGSRVLTRIENTDTAAINATPLSIKQAGVLTATGNAGIPLMDFEASGNGSVMALKYKEIAVNLNTGGGGTAKVTEVANFIPQFSIPMAIGLRVTATFMDNQTPAVAHPNGISKIGTINDEDAFYDSTGGSLNLKASGDTAVFPWVPATSKVVSQGGGVFNQANSDLRIEIGNYAAGGSQTTAGQVRVCLWYYKLTPPTS
tara:strand:- start:432 stop:2519 length:2088 start_codon:yes stop_codon:yes gene_type:complete